MATKWISPTWRMPEESNQSKFENYSLNFNGTSDFITCGPTEELNASATATWCGWFKPNGIVGGVLFSQWSATGSDQLISFSLTTSLTRIDIYLNTNIAFRASGGSALMVRDEWNFVCLTFNKDNVAADRLKLFINNARVTETVGFSGPSADLFSSTANLLIGSYYTATQEWLGQISQFAIYNLELDTDQMSALYNSGTPQNPMALTPLPITYYPLGGGSTGDAADPATTLTVPNESVPSATVFSYDDDKIDIPQISLTNNNTISIWAKRDDVSGADDRMMLLGSVDLYGYGCYFLENSTIYLKGSDQVAVAFSNTAVQTALERHDWVHWVFVKDSSSGTLAIYVDGDLAQSQSSASGMDTLNTIGNRGDGGNINQYCWHGEISNTQAWDTNLSPSEITTLYNNGVPYTGTQPQAANLKAWYKMNVDTSTWDGSDWIIGEAQANYTSALNFNGSSNINTSSNTGTNNVTFAAWIKTTETFNYSLSRCAFGGRMATSGSNYTLGRLGSVFFFS